MKLPVLILGSLLVAGEALGCSIIVRPLKVAYLDAKYVFVGKVRTVERGSATFDVEEQFAGEPVSEVTVETLSPCSWSGFETGRTYLVAVADEGSDGLTATQPTHLLESADDPVLRVIRRRAPWWSSPPGRISFYRIRRWIRWQYSWWFP